MKVVVFGATGKAGRAIALTLMVAGHQVTACGRKLEKIPAYDGIVPLVGDALNPADVERAVSGQDAVVVCLGDSVNPVALRLRVLKRNTSPQICELGTANVIAAMKAAGVARLVCITSYAIGDTRDRPSRLFRLWLRGLQLTEQLADKERQESLVKASGLDWTLIQPVGLTDGAATDRYVVSATGERRKRTISRVDLAGYVAETVRERRHVHETIVLSQLTISERDFAREAA